MGLKLMKKVTKKANKDALIEMTMVISVFLFFTIVLLVHDYYDVKVNGINYASPKQSFKEEEIIPEFKLDFELQNVTIKEEEKYEIQDFLPNAKDESLDDINYYYYEKEMSNYKEKGNYDIIIIFEDVNKKTIEKKSTLTIEKKEPIKTTKASDKKTSSTTKKINVKQVNTKKPTQKEIENKILTSNKKLGDSGRLYFSSLYSIALYSPDTSEEAQEFVDNQDSGAYYPHGSIMIIADHAHQGFSIIKSRKVGSYVYIKKVDENNQKILEKYIIREKTNGTNTGAYLITNDGRKLATDVNYDLALYTCNSADGKNITILLLDKVK